MTAEMRRWCVGGLVAVLVAIVPHECGNGSIKGSGLRHMEAERSQIDVQPGSGAQGVDVDDRGGWPGPESRGSWRRGRRHTREVGLQAGASIAKRSRSRGTIPTRTS